MINYLPSSEVKIKHEIIDILQKRGLVHKDEHGNVYYGNDKLAHLLMVISTYDRNIEESRLGETQALNTGGKFATNASVKRLFHEAWRYNFAIYSIMIGLKPWASSPTLPVRLKELEWAEAAYNQKGTPENVLEHHSLFLGEWTAFEELTGVHYVAGNHEETLRRIGEFWRNYDVIDPEAKLDKVPLIVAEIIYWLQQLSKRIDEVFITLEEVKVKDVVDTGELIELNERMDLLIEEMIELGDLLHGFHEKFLQLNEAARKAEMDVKVLKLQNGEKQKRISNLLTDDFAVASDSAQLGLESLKDALLKNLPDRLEEIEEKIAGEEESARFRMNKNRYISIKNSLKKSAKELSGRVDDAVEVISRMTVSVERLNRVVSKGKRRGRAREVREIEEVEEAPKEKEKTAIDFSIQEGD
jgi:hypothetical protein